MMTVLQGATASGRQFYSNPLGTASVALYTAPAASANVTSPSSTAYVKEIILCNYGASAATVNISIAAQYILYGVQVNAGDTKVLSGLNTMLLAGTSISGSASVANTIVATISGVEVQ